MYLRIPMDEAILALWLSLLADPPACSFLRVPFFVDIYVIDYKTSSHPSCIRLFPCLAIGTIPQAPIRDSCASASAELTAISTWKLPAAQR